MSEPAGGDQAEAQPEAGGAPPRGAAIGTAAGLLDPAPRFSIIIPIHNEAECLASEVVTLVGGLEAHGVDYELILAENGSSDDTPAIAEKLAGENARIRVLRVPVADYGAAMKAGMLAGRGNLIVNFDIDFHDVGFMLRAGDVLKAGGAGAGAAANAAGPGIVVGSKLVEGAEDRRSPARHFISQGFTTILRVLFDRHMDDTHGMKVLKREVVGRYAPRTIMTTDLFDTELIIRARREGVVVKALPVTVEERRKARSSIVRRIPRTIRGLLRLRIALWKEGSPGS
jgi:glycosyltransferase involved in cell wall biosynthesis